MRNAVLSIGIVLAVGCAQVREPTGGNKDTAAPELLLAEPPNGALRFSARRIVLRFNERVKLDRVRDRLLISPPMDRFPDVSVMGGTDVVILPRSPLLPNTTYTLHLGEAVSDITENNPATGVIYVFSTGDSLDSGTITGVVQDAYTGLPEAGAIVTLHADTDSAGFTSGRPLHYTRSGKDGSFRLGYLRRGEYSLHALHDQNANFRRDLPNERLAFLDGLVSTEDSAVHRLRMFLPPAPRQQVREATVIPDRALRVVFARPSSAVTLTSLDRTGGQLNWTPEWNPSRDTLLLWPNDTTFLQGQRFALIDTSGTLDTITYRASRKMPYDVDLRAYKIEAGSVLIRSSRPLARTEQDKVRWSSAIMLPTPAISPVEGTAGRNLRITTPPDAGAELDLLVLPGAFKDIYGGGHDTLRIHFSAAKAQETGDLFLRLRSPGDTLRTGPFILQLVDERGTVQGSGAFQSFPHEQRFSGAAAGRYTLRLIHDVDRDGEWTNGDIQPYRQPEPVIRLEGAVNIRAGWEVVQDLLVRVP